MTKQVKWVISDRYGSGNITNGGNTMTGMGSVGQYCCRIGWYSFESGVHKWKVQLKYEVRHDNFGGNYSSVNNAIGEIGIIDSDEVNPDIANSKKKWVCQCSLTSRGYHNPIETISLTLDMRRKTFKTRSSSNSRVNNYPFTATRVMPFFASNSPHLSLSLVE